MVFKSEYLTHASGPKAVFATGSTLTVMLTEMFCGPYPLACSVLTEYQLLFILMGMMMLDMITGVMAARSRGERLRSRRLGEGLKRKVAMLSVVAGGVMVSSAIQAALQLPGNAVPMVYVWLTSWFIGVEFLSLYENADYMGLRLPAFIKNGVEKLLQKVEQKGEGLAGEAEPKEAPTQDTDTPLEG